MNADIAPPFATAGRRFAPHVALRSAELGRLASALGVILILGTLAFTNGGYFPTAWGWSGLILFWLAALGLLLQPLAAIDTLQWTTVGALTAFVAWVALSTTWTTSPAQTPLEIERDLVYVAALLALLVFVRRRSVPHVIAALVCVTTVAAVYALMTRLFPERFGSFDSVAAYRLELPIGYWNALGIFVAIGTVLALGLAARSPSLAVRMCAGAATLALVPTLYFTFSRGAWIALGLGLLGAVALDRRRLQLIAFALVLTPWSAIAVAAAARSSALTRTGAPLAHASQQGHRLAWVVLVLAAFAALGVGVAARAERSVVVNRNARVAFAAALVAAAVAGGAGAVARYGSPPTMVRHAYRSFNAPPVMTNVRGTNLNRRLFNLSSNGRTTLWSAAWHDYAAHPLVGSGAGSYEHYWLAHRPIPMKVRDAHSLYAEVLAELGPVGLGLLVLALLTPLVAALRARRHPLVASVAGAYVAYIFHAGVDWDWEMVAVTLAGLICGAALLKAGARSSQTEPGPGARAALATAAAALAVFSLVGLLGNAAVAAANRASGAESWKREAKDAGRAMRFAPWRTDPWRLRAEARYALHERAGARADLLTALRKDPNDWNLWWYLAVVERGRARQAAFGRALALNPLSPELAQARSWLGLRRSAKTP